MITTRRFLGTAAVLGLLAACSSPTVDAGTGGGTSSGNTGGGTSSGDTGGGTSSGGTGGGDAGCQAYEVPAGTDLTKPVVSFKTDVMPIFEHNCSTANCHGVATGGAGDLFLGKANAGGADAAKVYNRIVGVASNELPGMPYVTAGDPSKSYLMHKMDGDQCLFESQCASGSCLALMPAGLTSPIQIPYRNTVRRWIAQGAKNN